MEQNEQTNDTEISDKDLSTVGGLKSIGFGLILIGVAYYFFTTMTSYENGEGISMNRLLLVAYKLLGKNISTGIISLIGAVMMYSGIKEIIFVKNQL